MKRIIEPRKKSDLVRIVFKLETSSLLSWLSTWDWSCIKEGKSIRLLDPVSDRGLVYRCLSFHKGCSNMSLLEFLFSGNQFRNALVSSLPVDWKLFTFTSLWCQPFSRNAEEIVRPQKQLEYATDLGFPVIPSPLYCFRLFSLLFENPLLDFLCPGALG